MTIDWTVRGVKGKRIVLAVTGGIAAYKAAAVCSQLSQLGAEVRVIMTEGATKFVSPLTFQVLSRNAVYTDVFEERDPTRIAHIDLADHTDLVVIAPATAHVIAKLAYGLADDMLTSMMLATRANVLVAPAMNVHMYEHPTVVQNIAQLKARGIRFIEPGEGQLACGYTGKGRMAEPEDIVSAALKLLKEKRDFAGLRVLVTAGPTVEAIDPVRYITNRSSGKMGYAIAEAAQARGADVVLISGPTALPVPGKVHIVHVKSAEEMRRAVLKRYSEQDVVIKAAAVSDYRPSEYTDHKLKKGEDTITLQLVRTPDILEELGRKKAHQVLVGFAAETDHVERYAMDKVRRKHLDLVVANDVTKEGAGFEGDTNAVSIYNREGLVRALPVMRKREVADVLLDEVRKLLHG